MALFDFVRRIAGGSAPSEPQLRMASIYRRKDKYYVTTSSKTRDGFWLEEGPVDVLEVGDGAALASAVRSALARSMHGIRPPKNWSSYTSNVVEAAGFKRFSAFAKGTALVGVDEEGGRIRIKPFRNGGSREGYLGLEDQALELPAGSPDLAQAIEEAFTRCR